MAWQDTGAFNGLRPLYSNGDPENNGMNNGMAQPPDGQYTASQTYLGYGEDYDDEDDDDELCLLDQQAYMAGFPDVRRICLQGKLRHGCST